MFDHATVERITSPRDIADGYDTKLAVYLDYAGQVPDWWTSDAMINHTFRGGDVLTYVRNGKTLHFRRPDGSSGVMGGSGHFDKERQRYVYKYSMRLAEVPVSDGPTFYKTTLEGSFTAREPDGKVNDSQVVEYAPLPISVQVRQPGEIVKVPPVSRRSLLRLQSVSITPPPTSYDKEATEVVIQV